jgi:hypothetical protein
MGNSFEVEPEKGKKHARRRGAATKLENREQVSARQQAI